MKSLVLGSSSLGRKRILQEAGYNIEQAIPNIDEKVIAVEHRKSNNAKELVLEVARAKARALVDKCPNSIIITSDQVIVCNGEIREKPSDEEECRRFLRSYGTYPAEGCNAILLMDTATGKTAEGFAYAKQYWKPIDEAVIDQVIKEGGVMSCAGGFMIEHELLKPFLAEREGEESTIVGFSMKLFKSLLSEFQQVDAKQ